MNDDERNKMISISKEKGFEAKKEGVDTDESNKLLYSKAVASSSSREWSGFRNPRIVRVSRSFGGKDRHSKVCTIRGLRDRRIRLSVPTAIQLYDLQDRLGLTQPSKVIDWLLDVTKNEIDKLPPLQIPQGFGQFHQQMLLSHDSSNLSHHQSSHPFFDVNSTFAKEGGIKINNNQTANVDVRSKGKEVERANFSEKGKWTKTNYDHQKDGDQQRFFPVPNHSSLSGFLNNATPFNSYYHWEPSNLSLAQYGSHEFPSQSDNNYLNTATTLPMQSSLAFPSGSHLFFCPPPAAVPVPVPSLFPSYSPYVSTPSETHDSRQMNHFQSLLSSQQHNNNINLPNSLTNINSQAKPFYHPGLSHAQTHDSPNKDNT